MSSNYWSSPTNNHDILVQFFPTVNHFSSSPSREALSLKLLVNPLVSLHSLIRSSSSVLSSSVYASLFIHTGGKMVEYGSSDFSSAVQRGNRLITQACSFYSRQDYRAAVTYCSQAIITCPHNPFCWLNRAACNFMLGEWDRVEIDCRTAIQLDNKIAQAHYSLGLAWVNKRKYTEGIRELERAFDLEREADPNYGLMVERTWQALVYAKYTEWQDASDRRSQELHNLKEACESALNEKHQSQRNGLTAEAEAAHSQQLAALETVFREVAEPDTPSDIPTYLCCPINRHIFRDPVITPSGHTYERKAILQHLQTSILDPITARPLRATELVPNLAIKEQVQAFLDKNGWAYSSYFANW
ncbi:E3 ubiquitin-protein ligase CHIP-like [Prosopis cineraria]|uniref:E3 ubiquitin-protein ligase CHIP-like n=1 Tax=Prosopis cineraria TaxID=364024 RepID=UPI00240F1574|nr:E3 ubiquitin-protein ligase CHIP-like [Prosopis cineraria]